MDLFDKHNRGSKDEVSGTVQALNHQDGNNSTRSMKQLLLISVTFCFLALSSVLVLGCLLFVQRAALHSIVILPHSLLETTGPMVGNLLTLNNQGSYCLLESSVDAIQESIKQGDNVALKLEGLTDEFVAVAMDQNNDQCFIDAQGRRVCVKLSTACEELRLEPRNRNLIFSDEEYDRICKEFIAEQDPEQWAYTLSFFSECAKDCEGQLACPCTCINDGLVLPIDSTEAPTPAPTNPPTPCRFRKGSRKCAKLNP